MLISKIWSTQYISLEPKRLVDIEDRSVALNETLLALNWILPVLVSMFSNLHVTCRVEKVLFEKETIRYRADWHGVVVQNDWTPFQFQWSS